MPPGHDLPFLLVMELGGASLFHLLTSQRLAGFDADAVRRMCAEVSTCTRRLHENHQLCQWTYF